MKFICLGYADQSKLESMPKAELEALVEECLAYDDELRRAGHFAGGEALQSATNAVTLAFRGGKVTVTDGPFAETKEQLGGILLLEAKDLNQAIALMTKHPGVKFGPFEIRPADEEFMKMIEQRNKKALAK
ncbi:MAG TPA: YciI family protein [Chroococcales cyanobacterium]